MIEDLNLFDEKGMDCSIAETGKITVLDISDLGRLGEYNLRDLVISIFAREQMARRSLYPTI